MIAFLMVNVGKYTIHGIIWENNEFKAIPEKYFLMYHLEEPSLSGYPVLSL